MVSLEATSMAPTMAVKSNEIFIYIKKKSQGMEDQKEEVNYSNKKSWFLGQFLLYRELREKKKKPSIWKKDPAIRVHGNNSSIPPPKGSAAILLGNCIPWKGEYQNILGTVEHRV